MLESGAISGTLTRACTSTQAMALHKFLQRLSPNNYNKATKESGISDDIAVFCKTRAGRASPSMT
jgi:hypothetical protein